MRTTLGCGSGASEAIVLQPDCCPCRSFSLLDRIKLISRSGACRSSCRRDEAGGKRAGPSAERGRGGGGGGISGRRAAVPPPPPLITAARPAALRRDRSTYSYDDTDRSIRVSETCRISTSRAAPPLHSALDLDEVAASGGGTRALLLLPVGIRPEAAGLRRSHAPIGQALLRDASRASKQTPAPARQGGAAPRRRAEAASRPARRRRRSSAASTPRMQRQPAMRCMLEPCALQEGAAPRFSALSPHPSPASHPSSSLPSQYLGLSSPSARNTLFLLFFASALSRSPTLLPVAPFAPRPTLTLSSSRA
jgi:hypothetical protein